MLKCKYNFSILILGLLIFMVAAGLNSCSTEAPFSPENNQPENAADISSVTNDFKYITWNSSTADGLRSLNKTISTTQFIQKRRGGKLSIESSRNSDKINTNVMADFTVLPLSIDNSKEISMSLDNEVIEFEFGPSGTTFEPAAKLSFSFSGLDLSNINPAKVNFYYLKPDGGTEVVLNEGIYVDIVSGTIQVLNAQINHFSRYALGKD